MSGLSRVLTPLGWAAAAVALLLLIAAASALWERAWGWLPWSQAARVERLEARAEQAEAEASDTRAILILERDQAARQEAAHRQTVAVRAATSESVTQARSAHDAETPLDPDRAARLRAHDRRLCELAPDLCAGPASDPS